MPANNMHVDIVLNDFGHAEQTRVARCIVTEGELEVHAERDSERWQSVAEDAYARAGGDIGSLYQVIHGDYMFATTPHDDDNCPFDQVSIPMPPIDVRTGQHAGHPAQ